MHASSDNGNRLGDDAKPIPVTEEPSQRASERLADRTNQQQQTERHVDEHGAKEKPRQALRRDFFSAQNVDMNAPRSSRLRPSTTVVTQGNGESNQSQENHGQTEQAMAASLDESPISLVRDMDLHLLSQEPVMAFSARSEVVKIPISYKQAIQSSDAEHWRAGMAKEIQSLETNGTFELTNLPDGRRAIETKWVFDAKRNMAGDIVTWKARAVAKGFRAVEGVDYFGTFSPVASYVTIRAFLAIAAARNWEIEQVDVATAFLNAPLDEEIYVRPPEGSPGSTTGKVWRLKKALYGLKQAGRQWWKTLSATFTEFGLKTSRADQCLLFGQNGELAVVVIVDDMAIGGSNSGVKGLIDYLESKFTIKKLGQLGTFVGLEIERDRENHLITIHQKRYAADICARFGLDTTKPTAVPIPVGSRFTKAYPGEDLADLKLYQSMMGSVMYLMLASRPDLAFVCGALSRYNSSPSMAHMRALQRVLKFVSGSQHFGLVLGGSEAIRGWTDAAFADCDDTGRSTAGYIFTIGGGAVSWSSKRQRLVTTSTTEAEYVAASEAAKEAIWISELMGDFGVDCCPISLLGDNTASLEVAKNHKSHGRTKHFRLREHFIRECVTEGTIEFSFTPTELQVADTLTKPVPPKIMDYFCTSVGITRNK